MEKWMDQVHKRFSDEQVRVMLQGYCQGVLPRADIQDMLAVSKSRLLVLLKRYRQDPAAFSVAYCRVAPTKLSAAVQAEIEHALLEEKQMVENPDLPISGYNYSALRDRLAKKGIGVSVTTIIQRAKRLGCYRPHKKRRVHDREALTASIGTLIQRNASTHLWPPLAGQKWALRASINDFSRKLLFADSFPQHAPRPRQGEQLGPNGQSPA
jgi:hypothetical protein